MRTVILATIFSLVAVGAQAQTLTTQNPSGMTLWGERFFEDLPEDAPLIVLFHQAGTDGRGEYGPLVGALNAAGFRAITWDTRGGGDRMGENRTVAALSDPGDQSAYCDYFDDIEAAFDASLAAAGVDRAIVWGSSFSGALVFQLAARAPDRVSAVVAASPASGGPLADCAPSLYFDEVAAPVLAMRPRREMEVPSVIAQFERFAELGYATLIVEGGVHGSSMLVDERTGADMSEERAEVIAWLRSRHPALPHTDPDTPAPTPID